MDESRRALTSGGFSALSAGTVLDRYRIDSLIAAGGFGITYLCHHITLGKPYALKEHFPRQFAYRDGTTMDVRPTDPETFTWALDRFIQEGRALATCHHPNVVGVADVFEANQTAYMVLGYEEGRSLKSWLDRLDRPPTQDEIDAILTPLLDALAYVHGQGLLHRDIAPDNIMIRSDGTPCLIDFGSARQAVAERSQMMSAVVKSGYSPPEQYTRAGRMQGPWSDIYALGATLYRMISGTTLPESTDRSIEDALRPIREEIADPSAYRAGFLDGIDGALAFHYAKRPQSIAEWRAILFDGAARPAEAANTPPSPSAISPTPVAPPISTEAAAGSSAPPPSVTTTSGSRSRGRKALIVAAALVLIGGTGIAMSIRQAANERAEVARKAEENDRAQRETAAAEQAQREAKAALDIEARDAAAKRRRVEAEQQAAAQRREAAARAERERAEAQRTQKAAAAAEAQKRADDDAPVARERAEREKGEAPRAQRSATAPAAARERGWLGIKIQNIDDSIAKSLGLDKAHGALATEITPGGPVDGSTLKAGDAIVAFDGVEIVNARDLARRVADLQPGTSVLLEVVGAGKREFIVIKLGTFPPDVAQNLKIIGLTLAEPADGVGKGIRIETVNVGSDAAEKGLSTGDRITEINGRAVERPADASAAIAEARDQGRTAVLLRILNRESQLRFVAVRLDAPGDASAPATASSADPALAIVPGSGRSFRDCPNCPEMVVVPLGQFVMGSPSSERGRTSEEGPQQSLSLAQPFAIGKFEVTFDEWDACIADGGCSHRPDDKGWGRGRRPVINVTWNQIVSQYLPWLSRKTGRAYRLPAEAEWEFAARGGSASAYWWGQDSDPSYANCKGCDNRGASSRTVDVGSYVANRFGIYDMSGNVFELTADCWNASHNGLHQNGIARTDGNCKRRVIRGGSWFTEAPWLRSAARSSDPIDYSNSNVGFRVAISLAGAERRIAALQEESAQRLAREREDAARAAKERADAQAAAATSSPNRAFDGHWSSPEWNYSYRLQDGIGVATRTNSPRFNVGDVIIRIRAVAPKVFEGEQVYRDGRWYRIRGELRSDGRIYISGEKNVNWHMERIE